MLECALAPSVSPNPRRVFRWRPSPEGILTRVAQDCACGDRNRKYTAGTPASQRSGKGENVSPDLPFVAPHRGAKEGASWGYLDHPVGGT